MTTTLFPDPHRVLRGHDFYPPARLLATMPALYSTEHQPVADKVIGLHYFTASCDWWLVELDPAEMLAWGYVCLGDPQMAEFGYVDLTELCALKTAHRAGLVVERDLHWEPVTVAEANLPGLLLDTA